MLEGFEVGEIALFTVGWQPPRLARMLASWAVRAATPVRELPTCGFSSHQFIQFRRALLQQC